MHNQQYQSSQSQIGLNHLESSLKDWIQQHPQNFEVKNLKLIFNNLKGMHEQFEQLQYAQPFNETLSQNKQEHLNLLDDDIQGFSDLVLKIRQQLTPQSALFRHAIRIAVVFAAGYAISSYLLTWLLDFAHQFICLPNYLLCNQKSFKA